MSRQQRIVACPGQCVEKCPVPRRKQQICEEAQDGSGRVCGSGQSVVGLTPPRQKLGLKEEVIDHFGKAGAGRWRLPGRGHLTRFHAPSCLLI